MYVTTESVINPDHNFHYNIKIKPQKVKVKDLAEAREVCMEFLKTHELGCGNWSGGDVYDKENKFIAYISYNGRVWDSHAWGNKAKEILLKKED